jgi:hypothetical protein
MSTFYGDMCHVDVNKSVFRIKWVDMAYHETEKFEPVGATNPASVPTPGR